ncbi:MAG: AAA family ATPase [Bacillales bacterium]|jgi:replicative DNA helicase|nr:AAA family ATPase [Bacillales bacterium]
MSLQLPYNIPAEEYILSAAINGIGRADIFSSLTKEHFYGTKNIVIFEALEVLYNRTGLGSYSSIFEELDNSGKLAEVGVELLNRISEIVVVEINVPLNIKLLQDKYLLRQILVLFDSTLNYYKENYNRAKDDSFITDTGEYLFDIEKKVVEITKQRSLEGFIKIPDILKVVKEEIKYSKGEIEGVHTFETLDKLTKGFQEGQLIVLAARPGVGKSAYALNLALETLNSQDENPNYEATIGIFCLEMTSSDIAKRLLQIKASVKAEELKGINDTGIIVQGSARWAESILKDYKIYIDQSTNLKIADIVVKVRKLDRESFGNLKYVIIDYLGLITPDNLKEEPTIYLPKMTRQLKSLALELKIPIILVCQMNRDSVQGAKTEEPKLNHLRGSGAIEQDADIIMFLQEIGKSSKSNYADDVKPMRLYVKKNRKGQTGDIDYEYQGSTFKFKELGFRKREDEKVPVKDENVEVVNDENKGTIK